MSTETAKARKRHNLQKGEEILQVLVANDYRVVQFSPYHFRINERLDIWPSSKRWWDNKSHRKGDYDDLLALVKEHLK